MKTGFQLIIPPTHLNEAYGSKYLSEEAKTEAKQGSLSEEKYQTLGCYPCPFCGERKSHKFYDKNMRTPNMNDMTRALIKGKALNVEEVDVTPKGLVIDEKETAKFFSKDVWYYKEYHCYTCGSIYRSGAYRKDHYVPLARVAE